MAPSQLKQLKASLRERGVGPQQQSKKEKQKAAKSGAAAADKVKRNAALQELREQLNPFEVRAPARPAKFDVTSRANREPERHKPGVTRALGEERRRATLLQEIHRKNKVGAVVDRRFGEDDPSMTPEQRAAERFARETQKKSRKQSMFNLEDDEEEAQLTHMGQSLFDGEDHGDDFQEDDLGASDDNSDSGEPQKRKRRAEEEDDMGGLASDNEEEEPARKKSKKEVMEEIIAKSKLHKYERQKAREDDDELRETLDKGMSGIFEVMRGTKRPEPEPHSAIDNVHPGRAALMNGTDKDTADREYDQRLKLMAFDKRSKPSERTKTAEEKAEEEAERLKQLEEERQKRMMGEQDEESGQENALDEPADDDSEPDDAKQFGLNQPNDRAEFDVEDEDDFVIDEDLVEMDSVADLSLSDGGESESFGKDTDNELEGEDDEFTSGLSLPMNGDAHSHTAIQSSSSDAHGLSYTYPCPESHTQFLHVIQDLEFEDLPTVVQRIRALHHPRLDPDNKTKLGIFARVLVQHVTYLSNQPNRPPFVIIENLLRHIHSLAKSHPEDVASAFRQHLRDMAENRPLKPIPGDLIALTGISTIFPTSDHFHAVVTPSMLAMGRYLGQGTIESLGDLATGAYMGSLCLQYQTLSKRYIPEFMNYLLNALCILSPSEPKNSLGYFPSRKPSEPLGLTAVKKSSLNVRKLSFWDILASPDESKPEQDTLKLSLISTFVSLLHGSADLWGGKSAFYEIFSPARRVLKHVRKSCSQVAPTPMSDKIQHTLDKLETHLSRAKRSRRPLLLHNHRPLAIKMAIPKFEETFNPERRYDPDRERAEMQKLKAEHKRERKGAVRELRKDANFIAREGLREKREKDAEYEKKYRRLVAEIQGEEGREAKAYEKEKKARQGKR